MVEWKINLKDDLRKDEGSRLKAYKCSEGVWTIGVGATKMLSGAPVKEGDVITEETLEKLLDRDIEIAIADAKKACPCFYALNNTRKAVISNLAFNLGYPRLAKFKNTLACICSGDYPQAALHMLKSKWATQVGQRAQRLSKQMSTGTR